MIKKTDTQKENKMKLVDLLQAVDGLKVLNNTPLPATVSYHLLENIEQINQHLERFEKVRNDLNTRVEEGSLEGVESHKQLNELLISEVDVDITKLKLESLQDAKLTPDQLRHVKFMIDTGVIDE